MDPIVLAGRRSGEVRGKPSVVVRRSSSDPARRSRMPWWLVTMLVCAPTSGGGWTLDPDVTFLNHGSFGACPRVVLDDQARWRGRMEAEPVRFLYRELEGHLGMARRALGAFVGADPDDLAFVTNATSGVNTVLQSLDFSAGDELIVSDHGYNACRNAVERVAARTGLRVVVVRIPFPITGSDAAVPGDPRAAVTPRTRLALLDHVTSPTGMVLPMSGW